MKGCQRRRDGSRKENDWKRGVMDAERERRREEAKDGRRYRKGRMEGYDDEKLRAEKRTKEGEKTK